MNEARPQVTVEAFFEHVHVPLGLEICAGGAAACTACSSRRAFRSRDSRSRVTRRSSIPIACRSWGRPSSPISRRSHPEGRDKATAILTSLNLACILVTKNLPLPDSLLFACNRTSTPLFRTSMTSSECIRKVLAYLDDLLSPRCRVHGVLVDRRGRGHLAHRRFGDREERVRAGARRGADIAWSPTTWWRSAVAARIWWGRRRRSSQDLIEIRGPGNPQRRRALRRGGDARSQEDRAAHRARGVVERSDLRSRRARGAHAQHPRPQPALAARSPCARAGTSQGSSRSLRATSFYVCADITRRSISTCASTRTCTATTGPPSPGEEPPPDLITGEIPSLFAAAELARRHRSHRGRGRVDCS